MINRRGFLSMGARAAAAAAAAYSATAASQGNLWLPARPAQAGRLEYTVTALGDGVCSPPVSVILRPQGARLAIATPTPFAAPIPPSIPPYPMERGRLSTGGGSTPSLMSRPAAERGTGRVGVGAAPSPMSGRAGVGFAPQVQTAVSPQTPIDSLTSAARRSGFRLAITRAENIDGASFTWQIGGETVRGAAIEIRPQQAAALEGSLSVTGSAGETLAEIPLVRLVAYDTPALLTQDLPHIGVQGHVNFDLPDAEGGIDTMAGVHKAIARIKQMGMNLVRTDWLWDKVNTSPGVYGWNNFRYEDVLRLLQSNGLSSLAILKGTPQWCSSQPDLPFPGYWNAPPSDARLYGEWVYRFIEHYGALIKMIEVYQEPNVSLYWNFDAAGLAACQREGFLHAKYADPTVCVGLTGLVGVPERATLGADGYWHYGPVLFEKPETFLNRIYQATNGHAWWDTLALHTYPDMDLFSTQTGFDLSRSIAFINDIKGVMRAYGDTTPLSVTEIGVSTPRDVPPPAAVAAYLGQLIDTIRRHTNTPLLIWYRLNEGPQWANPDHRRGLASYDLERLTPIGQTLATYIAQH